jgi:hypothetical protein
MDQRPHTQTTQTSRKQKPDPLAKDGLHEGHFIIGGLVLLLIVVVLVTSISYFSTERASFSEQEASPNQDTVAALDVPPALIETQPTLPIPPMVPDNPPLVVPYPTATPTVLPTPPLKPSPKPPPKPTETPLLPTPRPPEPAALRIRGLEITQGIQVFNEPEHARCQPDPNHPDYIFCNNSMPLVAGRHTLARLYLACTGNCPATETTIQLRLLKAGQEQANLTRQLSAETLLRANNLPLDELRLSLDNSINFEFFPPPEWLAGQVTFEASAGSTGEAPVTATLTKDFAVRKTLRVAYVPIQYQGLLPPEPSDIDHWLLRMYPVPAVEYYRLPVPDLVWEGELSKSEVLRKLLYVYWLYAQNNPPEAWPDQLFGWLPMEIFNGGISDPYWCPECVGPHSSRVAFGGLRPEQDIGGPRILVHEIAHNLGAQHAWSPTKQEDTYCFKAEGVDIQVDPAWPYAQTPHTQEFGIDLYSHPPLVYPRSFYDMMAYCTQPWISPYTYDKIFDSPFLQSDPTIPLPLADFRPQVEAAGDGALLVSGIVYPNGTVSQPEVIRLEGDTSSAFTPPVEFTPPPGEDYCLNVYGQDDAILTQHCFDVGFLDMETGETEPSSYFFTLPDTDAQDVAKVSISKNELALVIVTPSNTAPEVNVIFPDGRETLSGQQTIIWEATDADGDPLTYDLLYSPDNGQTWSPLAVRVKQSTYTFYAEQLSPTHDALIRVIANDGFHTTIDESDSPFTIGAPLENSLSLRGPANVNPGQTFDVAVVANRVTEPGLFGIQYKLNFDPRLLQVDSLRLHPDLDLVVDETIDNQAGQVSIIASRRGRVDNLTGDITLATFTFTARQIEDQAEIYLSEVGAGARGGVRLDISEVQGLSVRVAQ